MAKKRKQGYDREAVEFLAKEFNNIRQPTGNGKIPKICAEVKGLEEAIKALPKNHRETLEKFFGLIPNTINHAKKASLSKANDRAFEKQKEQTVIAIKALLYFEYLIMYDKNVNSYYNGILRKVNRKGTEELSDVEVMKYLILYRVFIEHGQRLFYEKDNYAINLLYESSLFFDDYVLMQNMWEEVYAFLPDNSVNLKLLIEVVGSFDCKDIVTMKKFVRLPIEKDLDDQEKTLESFAEVRLFKERIFTKGPWNVVNHLVFHASIYEKEKKELKGYFPVFWRNHKSIKHLKKGKQISLISSKGVKNVICSQIQNLQFSDEEEIVSLYLSRECI